MNNIDVVVSTVSREIYDDAHLERLKKIFHPAEFILVDRYDDQGVMKALERADVAVLTGDIDERFLKRQKIKMDSL